MRSSVWVWTAMIMGLILSGPPGCGPAADQSSEAGLSIPAQMVTDYVHAVIEADRTFYTMQVVERLQKQGKIVASEDWRTKHTLPLPAQFLKESSLLAELTGTKVQYHLIGIWPINPMGGPKNEFEKKGLDAVQQNPETPYTGIVTDADKKFFTAVYADRAVSQACISCHNADPRRSQKKDFQLNDVMGAVVISIPVPGKAAGGGKM